jgi:ubiquinone/menaquinone biosynthesis C-methylase UbiE
MSGGEEDKLPRSRGSDAPFDTVYTMETLVHSTDFRAALAEFQRVLRPGSRLVLIEYEHRATHRSTATQMALINDIASMPAF